MSDQDDDFKLPSPGDWIRLGIEPQADSNWLWGEVERSDRYEVGGQPFAMVRYTDLSQSSFLDAVVLENGNWCFTNRGFTTLGREWKAILEQRYAQWRRQQPKV